MKLALALMVCATAAFGQNAQISGLIQDPSASNVAGAEIAVRNEQTGGRRLTRSNESGLYSVPSLSPGIYRISIHASGFETIVRESVKLEVGEDARLDFTLRIGDSRTVITVKDGPPLMNTENASVGTIIGRNLIDQLPLNGRGIQTLVELTPGVVTVPVLATSAGQWAVNGQRTDANYFTVDGVSANFAVSVESTGLSGSITTIGQAGGGSLPANNLLGNFTNLVSPDALQEFQIQTSTFAPEFGRTPGAQVGLVTRSGTNRYSGSLFEFVRNDATDANDWFSNRLGVGKAPLRFNNFGASLGGPVKIPGVYNGCDRTFFFFSFEDLLMRQPQPPLVRLVPTGQTRLAASALAAPLLDAAPLPNRPEGTAPGWAEFVGRYFVNHDQRTYGLRVDHYFSDALTGFIRYNQSPAGVVDRSTDLAYETDTEHYTTQTQTLTVGLTQTIGPEFVNEIRLNGSRQLQDVSFGLDGFGGAQEPASSLLFPSGYSAKNAYISVLDATYPYSTPGFAIGTLSNDSARQIQAVDHFSYTHGTHQLKFGADYRWFSPVANPPRLEEQYIFDNVFSGIAQLADVGRTDSSTVYVVPAFSAYVQDIWRASRRVTVTYGLRWEVDPGPHVSNGQVFSLTELTSLTNFSNLSPAPAGKPFYPTQYTDLAPRLGIAWQLFDGQTRKTVLRAGAGRFYDLAQSGFEDNLAVPMSFGFYENVPFGSLPTSGLQDIANEYVAAAPGYTLPRVYEWNATVEQSFGQQTFSAAYVGGLGRRLTGYTTLNALNLPVLSDYFVNLFGNEFSSSYHSMQLQFKRRLAARVQTLISYTWAHSIDDLSSDLGAVNLYDFRRPSVDRGSSDFDVRHNMNGAVLVGLPSPRARIGSALFRGWTVNSIFFARSAPPSDLQSFSTFAGGYVRPDLVPGQQLYLYNPAYPGGKRFNPDAFADPTGNVEEGDLGRNVLRGFGAWQIDFALHRQFQVSERLSLQFRAEAFNLFNHPNFANPAWDSADPQHELVGARGFGLSSATLASSLGPTGTLGELNPLFQIGGPRSLQFALRLNF